MITKCGRVVERMLLAENLFAPTQKPIVTITPSSR